MYLLYKPQEDRDDCMAVLGVFSTREKAQAEIESRYESVIWRIVEDGNWGAWVFSSIPIVIEQINLDEYKKPYWEK